MGDIRAVIELLDKQMGGDYIAGDKFTDDYNSDNDIVKKATIMSRTNLSC